jgi:hypothetical protein
MSPNKIMFCEDCTLMGVPVPENNDTCGNCGSHNVTVFLPVDGGESALEDSPMVGQANDRNAIDIT